jgi:hypothetical protein
MLTGYDHGGTLPPGLSVARNDTPVPEQIRAVNDDCKCAGIEEFIQSDTGNEFAGVNVICTLCGREFSLIDISESKPLTCSG